MKKQISQRSLFKYSIIIPNYNSEKTIDKCLKSILEIKSLDKTEIIVCDNNSTDFSLDIIKKYPVKLLVNKEIQNASSTRNYAAKHAKNEYLIFVDSDVTVPKNLIDIIESDVNFVSSNCLHGIFSLENDYENFFSQYKTLYCNFKYKGFNAGLNSAIMIIKKDYFFKVGCFNEKLNHAEDEELGYRLREKGAIISLNHELSVDHIKYFDFFSLLKNDFVKSRQLTISYTHFFFKNKIKLKQNNYYITLYFKSIITLTFIYFFTFSLILAFFLNSKALLLIAFFLAILYVINNSSFFIFCKKNRGYLFLIKSIFFSMISYFVVSLAVANGLFKLFIKFIKSFLRIIK